METSLHRQLKELYAGDEGEVEARRGAYRIDVVLGDTFIEVQHAGLAAIRDKVRKLCAKHRVLVVKPIVVTKHLVRLASHDGPELSRRKSPKRGELVDLFDDLVHFTRAFPHKRLAIEALLVEVEELRAPGHGRRRRWRKDDQIVVDQRLVGVLDRVRFERASDLWKLAPGALPAIFDTAELAVALGAARQVAQRAAYCLREMGAVADAGKRGNARLYRRKGRRAA
ncbi:MAG: hypothetical protein ACRCT8_04290 [Lacipirellulaceae bacterium]